MACALPYLPASTPYAVVGCCKIALVVLLAHLGLPVARQDPVHYPFPLDLQVVHLGRQDPVRFPLDLQVVHSGRLDLVVHLEVQDQADHPEVRGQVLSNVIHHICAFFFSPPKERGIATILASSLLYLVNPIHEIRYCQSSCSFQSTIRVATHVL